MAGGITSEKQKDPKRVATSYPGSFFGKDPGCGWSRASSKISRPRGCGESIKLHQHASNGIFVKKHKFCELLRSKYLLIFVYFLCFEFTRTFLHCYLQSSQETKQIVTRSALSCCYLMHALFTLERGCNKRLW
jgi:hypothetical protein